MKWVKRIAIALGALLVLAIGLIVVFFYVVHPKMRDAPKVTAPTSPEAIARGEYLARHVAGCVLCHSPIDEAKPGDDVVETSYSPAASSPCPRASPACSSART